MNDVMSRIATIRSRFVAGPAPVRTSTSAPTASTGTAGDDAFSSVLATKRALLTGTDPSGSVTGAPDVASLAAQTRALASSTAGTAKALGALARQTYTSSATTPVPASYESYRDLIGTVATEEGVPASLLGALVWSESGFDQNAVSPAGARGLAQLMPGTADGLGVNIDDPADNLRGGARYLRSMLDRFGSVDLALAAYNAGPNAVTRAGGIPAYQETQTYVTRVMARAAQLSGGAPS